MSNEPKDPNPSEVTTPEEGDEQKEQVIKELTEEMLDEVAGGFGLIAASTCTCPSSEAC